MTARTHSLVARQFTTPLSLSDALRVVMDFSDSRHTITLSEEADSVLFHIDYVESNNRLGEVMGILYADEDSTYVEYTTDSHLEPYQQRPSYFLWAIAAVGILWIGSAVYTVITGSSTSAWIFVLSLVTLLILNRIDNETSPDYETKERECLYLMQRLNSAFEEAEAAALQKAAREQFAG